MNIGHWSITAAAAAGLMFPALVSAQKREDFIALQRDVAQLQDQMKQLQRSQDEKMAALTALVQQAVDASSRVSLGMSAFEKTVNSALSDQQSRVTAPVVSLGAKVDQMSEDSRSLRESISDLANRLGKLDAKLTDVSIAVRTLSTPVAPPSPAGGLSSGAAAGPPPGVSAEGLYENARRDYSSAKYELAMDEFANYVKYFPLSENAPAAQYYIGMIYDSSKQYDEAAKAFDLVLEHFAENPKTPEALYMKGVELMKAGQRTDSVAEFKEFLKRYPAHELAPKAQAHLKELGMAVPAKPRARRK